jgi:hypothetical protein
VTDEPRSPISAVDTVDIVGVRKEGGLDMIISVTGPIDDSPATLALLEAKVRNYIRGARSEAFLQQFDCVGTPVTIYILCPYPITDKARGLIEELRVAALGAGIDLALRAHTH